MYRTFPCRGGGDKKQSALCKVSLGDRSFKHFFVAENYDRKLQRTKTVLKNAYNRQDRRQLHPGTGTVHRQSKTERTDQEA